MAKIANLGGAKQILPIGRKDYLPSGDIRKPSTLIWLIYKLDFHSKS
jgi:hypothetical protein